MNIYSFEVPWQQLQALPEAIGTLLANASGGNIYSVTGYVEGGQVHLDLAVGEVIRAGGEFPVIAPYLPSPALQAVARCSGWERDAFGLLPAILAEPSFEVYWQPPFFEPVAWLLGCDVATVESLAKEAHEHRPLLARELIPEWPAIWAEFAKQAAEAEEKLWA